LTRSEFCLKQAVAVSWYPGDVYQHTVTDVLYCQYPDEYVFLTTLKGGIMAITSSSETRASGSRVAGWLSPDEFRILEVACDTLLPSLEPPPRKFCSASRVLSTTRQRLACCSTPGGDAGPGGRGGGGPG